MTANVIGLKYAVEQLAGEGLRVSYRVTNGSERSIFLTTPVVDVDEDLNIPRLGHVYTYLDTEGILHITRRVWPVPDDVDIYIPEVPRLTEVRAGAAFEERFACAVPVEVSYPYRFAGEEEPATPSEVVTGEAYRVAFSIGYLTGGEGREDELPRPGDNRNAKEGLFVSYALATAHQKILQGAVVAMRVNVRDMNRQEM